MATNGAATTAATPAAASYQAAVRLFTDFPLAVEPVTLDGDQHMMALICRDGGDAAPWALTWHREPGYPPAFSLRPLPIARGTQATVIGQCWVDAGSAGAACLATAYPVPRDGSLFGWVHGGTVTALVATWTDPQDGRHWAVMPRAGTSCLQWPPFAGERLFPKSFWGHLAALRIVSLADAVAGSPRTVWWVPSTARDGTASCAVREEVTFGHGTTLPAGVYAHHTTILSGGAVPTLRAALASRAKTDFTPSLRRRMA